MTTPVIRPWVPADREAAVELVVSIQQGEFDLPITAADQPDLVDVAGHYQQLGGEFWVAELDGRIVGTIGALVVEENTVAVRKMFVHRDQRGGTGLAAALMDTLAAWARGAGYRTILLGTTDRMAAAHRFYAKHGFTEISPEALPATFPRMAVDSLFFRRELLGVVALREPNPAWPAVYAGVRDRLTAALSPLSITVEHTGSTSVPGLAAKPIIDVTMTVPDTTDEAAYVPALERAGFRFVLREPEWFEHRLFNGDWPRVNLHVFSHDCEEVARMLAFRDHLRADDDDRRLYERVKRDLAARDWAAVQDYADAKTTVVQDILTRALRR